MWWTEQVAERLARAVHDGVEDKVGQPYIGHVERVVGHVRSLGGSSIQVMAAWLHDVVEDSPLTLEDLETMAAPVGVLRLVEAVTHRKNEPLIEYYQRIVSEPGAVLVKQGDLMDNTDPTRTALLDPETRERLARKYENAYRLLGISQD